MASLIMRLFFNNLKLKVVNCRKSNFKPLVNGKNKGISKCLRAKHKR